MKKLVLILAAVAALCMGALAYIALYLSNTIVEERNRRQTEPARMARHAKKEDPARLVNDQSPKPPETEQGNEKQEVA